MIKKTIWIVAALVVLGGIAWGISYLKPSAEEELAKKCGVDLQAIVLPDPEGKLKTDKEISQAMFDHYFAAYKEIPNCGAAGLEDARLTAFGTSTRDRDNHFIMNITFDLKPVSMTETRWATPETSTTTDGWIKNKKGSLSITSTSSTYYLII